MVFFCSLKRFSSFVIYISRSSSKFIKALKHKTLPVYVHKRNENKTYLCSNSNPYNYSVFDVFKWFYFNWLISFSWRFCLMTEFCLCLLLVQGQYKAIRNSSDSEDVVTTSPRKSTMRRQFLVTRTKTDMTKFLSRENFAKAVASSFTLSGKVVVQH